MSRTYKDLNKGKCKRLQKESHLLWLDYSPTKILWWRQGPEQAYFDNNICPVNKWLSRLTWKEKAFYEQWYKVSPSHWNRLYHRVPARRKSKQLIHLYYKTGREDLVFPDYKRPHVYYW